VEETGPSHPSSMSMQRRGPRAGTGSGSGADGTRIRATKEEQPGRSDARNHSGIRTLALLCIKVYTTRPVKQRKIRRRFN
jgi:hypothetical protein